MFAFDFDEFAHKALEGAFGDGDGFALGELIEDEFDGFVGKVAHKAEAFNLVVGDGNGFAEFADEGYGAVDVQDVAEFGFLNFHEDVTVDNGDNDFLDAVAPLAFDGLQGQVVLDVCFGKTVADFFLGSGGSI